MSWLFLAHFIGCTTIDICDGTPPEEAEPIGFELIPWDEGPEYDEANGWTGVIYSSQEEWDAFIADNSLSDPTSSIDFSLNDVLLYERIYNGCEFEVVFDGAYLLDNTRYIRAQSGEYDAHSCDIYSPRHAILIVEKKDGAELEFCSPYKD